MSDLPIYGEASVARTPTRPRQPLPKRRLMIGVGVVVGISMSVGALAASTPSPPSYAPYYLATELPDGWVLDSIETQEAETPSPNTLPPDITEIFVHLTGNTYDQFLEVSTNPWPISSGANDLQIDDEDGFLTAVFTIDDCGGSALVHGVDRGALEAAIAAARCQRKGDSRRIVLRPPFKAVKLKAERYQATRTVFVTYRGTDGEVVKINSSPRPRSTPRPAWTDGGTHRERFGYGYLTSTLLPGPCPDDRLAFASRVDGNRLVSVYGTVDQDTAVRFLRSVVQVNNKRWHKMVDPIATRQSLSFSFSCNPEAPASS